MIFLRGVGLFLVELGRGAYLGLRGEEEYEIKMGNRSASKKTKKIKHLPWRTKQVRSRAPIWHDAVNNVLAVITRCSVVASI